MLILESWLRVSDKIDKLADIVGYRLVAPVVPAAINFGPQEESDVFEAKLDKCIKDRVDYFAKEFGYDPEKKRAEVERMKGIFLPDVKQK